MSVRVRRAEAADCASMPEFRRRMEGGAFLADLRGEAFYRVKFLETGLAFVAVDGERLVGVTAATPRRVRTGDEVVGAAELGDLFVDPEYRGRGLFRELHDAVLGALRDAGTALVTVRAGRGAAPLMRGPFGYRRLLGVAEAVARCGPTSGLRRIVLRRAKTTPVPPPAGYETEEAAPETAGCDLFDGPWPRAGVIRDADRLAARYAAEPTPYRGARLLVGGRPAGGAVVLVAEGRGFLVDLWLAPDAAPGADLLVRHSLRVLEAGGARVVHYWRAREAGPDRDPLAAAVRDAGLRVLRRRKTVLAKRLDEAAPALPAPADWIFRMGDTDGI